MDKPFTHRTYTVCVKSSRGSNTKTFSLYTKKMSLEMIYSIVKKMIFDERDEYINFENRYGFEDSNSKKNSHVFQVCEYNEDGNCCDSKSLSFKESMYNANEIADILESWFKKSKRIKEYPKKGVVVDYIHNALGG